MQKARSWWLDSLFILFFLGTLYFILLGTRPLFVPDEGRYAEIAREMVARQDYVTPYLNSIKYFEKPVLFYWLGAAAIKIGGLNLWSIRSINALLGLIGCLLTYYTTRKCYDRTTGLLAALILGSSTLYFVMSHMISLDLPVTVFISASLFTFLLGTQETHPVKRRALIWTAAATAGLAVLTKGLIGIVFPALIIATWLTTAQQWRVLKQCYIPSAFLIFLLITLPWHILVQTRNPEFFYFYIIEQHFLRYTNKEIGHYQPVWFFIPAFIVGFFPWIVFLPQALWKMLSNIRKKQLLYKTDLFFILWAVLIFAFFSFSKSKLIPYILPVFPPVAILTARYLRLSLLNKQFLGIKLGYAALVLFAGVFAFVFYSFSKHTPLPNNASASFYLMGAGFIITTGSLFACLTAFRSAAKAILLTLATMWVFLLLVIASMPSVDARSIRPLADTLKPLLAPNDDVITYNQYFQDLPFYLERRVSILNWRNELTYGMQHQDTREWLINETTFWQRWHSKTRVFVLIDQEEYQKLAARFPQEKFHVVNSTLNNVLIANQSLRFS